MGLPLFSGASARVWATVAGRGSVYRYFGKLSKITCQEVSVQTTQPILQKLLSNLTTKIPRVDAKLSGTNLHYPVRSRSVSIFLT